MKPRRILAGVLTVLFVLGVGYLGFAEKEEPLDEALKHFEKHNYKDALALFRKALEGEVPDRADVEMKTILCLGKLNEWDEAVKEAGGFIGRHEGTVWEARGLQTRAALLFERPHYGYRTQDGKFTRGRYVRGGFYIESEEEDIVGAVKDLERARTLFALLRDRAREKKEDEKPLRSESVSVNLDLAQVLEAQAQHWRFEALLNEKKEDAERVAGPVYDPSWPLRLRVSFLYDEVRGLDDGKDRGLTALSAYRKAMFFHRVGALRDAEKPLPILDAMLAEFPKDELADEALYATGLVLEEQEDYLGAKDRFARVAKEYAGSPWVSDAAFHVREMERPQIWMDASGVRLPAGGQEVKVRTRNVKTLSLAAFPVKLEKLFADGRNDARNWQTYFDTFLAEGGGREYWDIQVEEWTHETGDGADHRWVDGTMRVPVEQAGAYVIEARGRSVTFHSVLVLSDLAVIRKMDGRRMLVWATDAVTGRKVPGAKVAVRVKYWVRGGARTEYYEGSTDENGLYERELNPAGNNSKNVQVLAWRGDRYAATGMQGWYWSGGPDAKMVRIYAYTERPVYRPGQTVRFKALLREHDEGAYRNVPNESVTLEIRDAKNKPVYKEALETNEYGSVEGELKLGEEPPLGVYRMRFRLAGKVRVNVAAGSQFRVEEYKKPEYEVTVTSEKPQVKLGEAFRAQIVARYYFGAPVADADVTWRVFRRDYRHSFVPAGEYDWLYGRGYGWRPWWYYVWGPWEPPAEELVLSGEGKTDADGNAFVDIATEGFAAIGKDLGERAPDHVFTVTAEVRDSSRRTIEGSGTIKVTRNEYYAFVETPRGFFEKGERAKFEILTQNASGVPVKAVGKVVVSLLVPVEGDPEADPERRPLLEEALSTDANGRAWYAFVPDKEGRFEVAFQSSDSWGGAVVGRREVWIVGEEFEGWRFRFSEVEILTDKRSYEEGDTVRIMLNVNRRGADVLFTLEGGNEILTHRVVPMADKSVILPLKLDKRHVPNVYARAALFSGGVPYMEDREIFVPPASQFLDVKVDPGKKNYLPGEKATWQVQVQDRRGAPVQCEVSLGVIDRSVLYIQPEFSPDVRKFYYGDRRGLYSHPDSSLHHEFTSHAEDAALYPQIKRHGDPPGWWGYGHWRDSFNDDDGLQSGLRFGARRGGRTKGEDGGEGGGWGEEAPAESEELERDAEAPSGGPAKPMARRALHNGAEGKKIAGKAGFAAGEDGPGEAEPEVRENFADTAFWNPRTVTGADGTAVFTFEMPDSLTAWKGTVVAADAVSRVGNAAAETVTRKNLIVRLAAPRFFTERDEVTLSGIANNYLSTAKKVRFELGLEGGCLEALGEASLVAEVPAGGTARVNFDVRAVKDGEAVVILKALTDEESDAVKMTFPVIVHGMEKTVTVTGILRDYTKNDLQVTLSVPKERDPAASALEIRVSPSIASCMLDALPYLIEYPYGCVEQTMSRFLPAVTVARTLKELKLDLEDIGRKRAEINAAHLSERVKAGWHTLPDPVFDSGTLERIVRQGLERLATFQKGDGGFGWWPSSYASDPFMTAYVTYGLLEAKRAGFAVDDMRLGRALAFLSTAAKEDKSLHRRAYISWVLVQGGAAEPADLDVLFERRDDLNHYTKSLLALALHGAGRTDEARTVLENVLQFATHDEANGTCFLDTGAAHWWIWYNDRIEATVFMLRGLMAIMPKDPRIHAVVKWLVNNRKGGRWSSTKDTANAIYALAEYIRAEDELNPEYTVTVDWPGVGRKEFHVTKSNVFSFDDLFLVGGEAVPAGDHTITVTREGKGSVYVTAHLRYFSKEEDLKGAGHELFVQRSFFKMIPRTKKVERDGRTIEVLDWERVPLKSGEAVTSGDRIEVRLDIEAKNRYEYLVFEDMKPAGLEPVQLRSGFSYGNLCSNMELRDEKVVFFTDALETGKHVLLYVMRAEVPGRFHALPTRAWAMYAPKVGGISDEWRLEIKD